MSTQDPHTLGERVEILERQNRRLRRALLLLPLAGLLLGAFSWRPVAAVLAPNKASWPSRGAVQSPA